MNKYQYERVKPGDIISPTNGWHAGFKYIITSKRAGLIYAHSDDAEEDICLCYSACRLIRYFV